MEAWCEYDIFLLVEYECKMVLIFLGTYSSIKFLQYLVDIGMGKAWIWVLILQMDKNQVQQSSSGTRPIAGLRYAPSPQINPILEVIICFNS